MLFEIRQLLSADFRIAGDPSVMALNRTTETGHGQLVYHSFEDLKTYNQTIIQPTHAITYKMKG